MKPGTEEGSGMEPGELGPVNFNFLKQVQEYNVFNGPRRSKGLACKKHSTHVSCCGCYCSFYYNSGGEGAWEKS